MYIYIYTNYNNICLFIYLIYFFITWEWGYFHWSKRFQVCHLYFILHSPPTHKVAPLLTSVAGAVVTTTHSEIDH